MVLYDSIYIYIHVYVYVNPIAYLSCCHLPTSRIVLIRCPWPATVASNGRAGRSPKRFTERRSMAHKLLDTETRAALNKNGGSSGHATPMQLIKLMT